MNNELSKKSLLVFFKELLINPIKMGAAFPSSERLAKALAEMVPKTSGNVLELGPGTGVITQALLNRGFEKQVILLEQSQNMVMHLQALFPNLKILNGDALQLTHYFKDEQTFSTIVSSLPLRLFSAEQLDLLWQQLAAKLTPNGLFIQFTYDLWMKPFAIPNLNFKKSKTIWLNAPPAKIIVYQK